MSGAATVLKYPPDAIGEDGRPLAYGVAEFLANECETMEQARACRCYLAGWPDGPQGDALPLARVGLLLGLTRQAVLHQVKTGHLHAVWMVDRWLVPFGELERWKPVKAGRKRKEP